MATNAKISSMRDQLIMARAYLQFTPPNSNSRLVRELKLRIKETKSILSQANKDSDLSRRLVNSSHEIAGGEKKI